MTFSKLVVSALPIITVALTWISSVPVCHGQSVGNLASIKSGITSFDTSFALVPPKRFELAPQAAEIYEYDRTALGDREAVLLVHGLIGEFHPLFRWQELAKYLSRNHEFQKRYKIYLVRYNTHTSLKNMTEDLGQAIIKTAPPGGLNIVAISLSGAVLRNAMKDERVNKSVKKVITMGAFFRGSPLFCTEWMAMSIKKRHISPFYRADRLLAYKIYFALHKQLVSDFSWDNVDGQMPADILDKVVSRTASSRTKESNPQISTKLPGDHKFIVYAGYLHNQYVPEHQGKAKKTLLAPFKFLDTTLPMHFGLEHPALRYINNMIADAVPGKGDPNKVIYPLNDGISPVSSSLLLTDEFMANTDLSFCDKASMQSFGQHTYAKKARLFEDADHLTFIEAKRPSGSDQNVEDVLNQSEKPRPVFDWIIKDLME